MLEYEWGNPSTIILTRNEGGAATEPDQTHQQILDQNYTFLLSQPQHAPTPTTTGFSHQHHFNPPEPNHHQHHTFFDPRAFTGASPTSFSPPPFSLDPIPPFNAAHYRPEPGPGLFCRPIDFVGSGLGLNLGGRTYSASSNDDIANGLYHLYKSSVEVSCTVSSNSPRCQAEGCNLDLSDAKHYHRRHKVCEFHSKAAAVIAAGFTQRFCQQCSRFHLLSEFDHGKRSCRKRLEDHNRRRRKIQKSQPTLDNVTNPRRTPEFNRHHR